jgi:uncharacterized protein with GYD domain
MAIRGEVPMPHFMVQGAYTAETWAGMVKNPEDRTGPVNALLESLGGKLESFYFCFGEDDFVGIAEVPDNVTAAALAIAVASSKAFRQLRSTPLLTSKEVVEAAKKAGKAAYKAPGR